MTAKRRGRVVVLVLSALLLCGGVVWFAVRDLGAADQIASVASFLVGLTGLVWAIRQPRAQPGRTVEVRDSIGVFTGDGSVNEMTVNIDQRPSLWRRSKRRR